MNKEKRPIKLGFVLTCKFKKVDVSTGDTTHERMYFHATKEGEGPKVVTEATDLSKTFDDTTQILLGRVEEFQGKGSGWIFSKVEFFDIAAVPFEPLSGSSYIPLPPVLAKKKAIINVKQGP